MPSDLPESRAQAEKFDQHVRDYSKAGFCRACSVQAASGHAVGFDRVRPVCAACQGRRTPPLDLPGGRRRPANARLWAECR